MQQILDKTIEFYNKENLFSGLKIKKILLRFPDTMVFLNNGCFASAANYDYGRLGKAKLLKMEVALNQSVKRDSLSIQDILIKQDDQDLLLLSLKIATINAVSQSFLNNEFLKQYNLEIVKYKESDLINKIVEKGDKSCVIGFGGWLFDFLKNDQIEKVYCLDFFHNEFNDPVVLETLDKLNLNNEKVRDKLELGGQGETEEFIKKANIVFITGCALANDSMEKLLDYAKDAHDIIISGHTTSFIPVIFHQNKVSVFCTKLFKENFLNELKNVSDDDFRKIVDKKSVPVLIKRI